jgi:hypothetical protein
LRRRLSASTSSRTFRLHALPHPVFDRMRFLFTMSEIEDRKEWRRTEIPSPTVRPSSRRALARSTKLIKCIGRMAQKRDTPRTRPARPSSVVCPPSSEWWSQTGSNRRPHACKARALPTELWPRRRKPELGKTLSDFRFLISAVRMVGLGGLEPPTSRLSSARSNQLSYKPDSENGGRRTEDTKALSVLRRPLSVVRKERETKAARSRKPRPDWPL